MQFKMNRLVMAVLAHAYKYTRLILYCNSLVKINIY